MENDGAENRIERVDGDGRDRRGIPVGDVRDGCVFTATVDEESGKSVVVVDKRTFVSMVESAGFHMAMREGSGPFGWGCDPLGYGSDRILAESALREVEGAIRSDDAIVVFK